MTFFDFVVVVLCAGAITEFVRHASLLEDWRQRHHTTNSGLKPLLDCGFCLSHWGAVVAVLLVLPYALHPCWWTLPPWFLALAGAATRASNLVNDLGYRYNRTNHPRDDGVRSE